MFVSVWKGGRYYFMTIVRSISRVTEGFVYLSHQRDSLRMSKYFGAWLSYRSIFLLFWFSFCLFVDKRGRNFVVTFIYHHIQEHITFEKQEMHDLLLYLSKQDKTNDKRFEITVFLVRDTRTTSITGGKILLFNIE